MKPGSWFGSAGRLAAVVVVGLLVAAPLALPTVQAWGNAYTCRFFGTPASGGGTSDGCPWVGTGRPFDVGDQIRFSNNDPLGLTWGAVVQDASGTAVTPSVCLAPGTLSAWYTLPVGSSPSYTIVWYECMTTLGAPVKVVPTSPAGGGLGGVPPFPPKHGCVKEPSILGGVEDCGGRPPWDPRDCFGAWRKFPDGTHGYVIVCKHDEGAYVCEGEYRNGQYDEDCAGRDEQGCTGTWHDKGTITTDEKGNKVRESDKTWTRRPIC